jgi:hypothetical protein
VTPPPPSIPGTPPLIIDVDLLDEPTMDPADIPDIPSLNMDVDETTVTVDAATKEGDGDTDYVSPVICWFSVRTLNDMSVVCTVF